MSEGTPIKQCRCCKEGKPLDAFYPDERYRMGVRSECKQCVRSGKLFQAPRVEAAERECKVCKETKPLTREYWYQHSKKTGFIHKCKVCFQANQAFRKYGVSVEWYESTLRAQGGVCAICGGINMGKLSEIKLSIDHCHETGLVRGLLCKMCNLAISYLRDDPELCRKAAGYLEEERTGVS